MVCPLVLVQFLFDSYYLLKYFHRTPGTRSTSPTTVAGGYRGGTPKSLDLAIAGPISVTSPTSLPPPPHSSALYEVGSGARKVGNGGWERASWSLFLLLSCIPIGRAITVEYVSSSHSLLFSDGHFDAGLGVIWSSNPYICHFPIFPQGRLSRSLDLSINTPNWNTLYAARVARNMKLSGDEKGDE